MLRISFVLRCHVSIYEWMICVKIIKCFHALAALDNFYKLSCILLIFFALNFLLRGIFYYCTVTFEDCVHLYDFAIDKNAS